MTENTRPVGEVEHSGDRYAMGVEPRPDRVDWNAVRRERRDRATVRRVGDGRISGMGQLGDPLG